MTVKEFYKKYSKDYTIYPYGKPLKDCQYNGSYLTPWYAVKYDNKKEYYARTVVEYVINDYKESYYQLNFDASFKLKSKKRKKGEIYVYVKKEV